MRSIVGGFERAQISSLEPVVLTRADCHVESFARHILQTTAAAAIESWPSERLAITAAVTNAQPAVLPQFSGRAEALRRVNISTEATSADRTNAGCGAKDADLRESLRRAQHQQPRLRRHALIQHGVQLRGGGAQVA